MSAARAPAARVRATGTVTICLAVLLAGALSPSVRAQESGYPPPLEADFVIRDFHFTSGETLPELRIHYRTLGKPRADSHGEIGRAHV
jgi:homoserine O-acetyltransferase/O-succinyltransferase